MRKSLRTRFVSYFFVIMLTATLIATAVAYVYINVRMENKLEINQREIAETLITLSKETDGVLLDLSDTGSFEVYSIHRVDRLLLEDDIRLRLDDGEIVIDDGWLLPTGMTYFSVGGQYYQISLFPNSTFFFQLVVSLVVALCCALVLGTLFATFAGTRFLRPIRELSRATERVALGDFSVSVSAPKDSEMGKLVSNFNKMAADLGRIETLQKEFISNVSHEFKSPLASISGYAKLLQSSNIPEEERVEFAGVIAAESERLSHLSTNILRLTKLEHTELVPEKAEFQLDEQLRCVIATMENQWSEKHLTMDVELDDESICGCAELLQEVWMNLLSNAIKFSAEGGRVYVRLRGMLDTVAVEIEDDGCGMTADVKKRIFDKFYQGDSSHSGEGNGLGLSLVKRICTLCGAAIEVESSPGDGSLFRVILPRE